MLLCTYTREEGVGVLPPPTFIPTLPSDLTSEENLVSGKKIVAVHLTKKMLLHLEAQQGEHCAAWALFCHIKKPGHEFWC